LDFSYSESCELCACNGNPTIAMICTKLMPLVEPPAVVMGAMVAPIQFPKCFGPPSTMGSIANNYMTIEEVREFMFNEQKVCTKIFFYFVYI